MDAETLKKTETHGKHIGDIGCMIINLLAVIVLLGLGLPVVYYVRNTEGHSVKNWKGNGKESLYRDSTGGSVFPFPPRERSGIGLVIEF